MGLKNLYIYSSLHDESLEYRPLLLKVPFILMGEECYHYFKLMLIGYFSGGQ